MGGGELNCEGEVAKAGETARLTAADERDDFQPVAVGQQMFGVSRSRYEF